MTQDYSVEPATDHGLDQLRASATSHRALPAKPDDTPWHGIKRAKGDKREASGLRPMR